MNDYRIAKVVFPIAVNKEFDYTFPKTARVRKGSRVLVEFNKKKRIGVVVSLSKLSKIKNLKTIIEVLELNPSLSSEHLRFAKKLSQDYLCSWGEIIFMMLPSYLKNKKCLSLPPVKNFKTKETCSIKCIRANSFLERFDLYKEEIQTNIQSGSVVVCFPIISYLKEAYKLITKYFSKDSLVIHSYQSPKENFKNWLLTREGRKIIVGTRLALFYYPWDLGLVILEEENSPYYFQPEKPYYHLLDIALSLCRFKKIKLILSSDYPSLATYKNYKKKIVDLKERLDVRKNIEVFDLRNFSTKYRLIFSPFLIELMRKNLQNNKRVLILWSRRNLSNILRCNHCGHVFQCKRCSSPLKFSLEQRAGVCSWCGYKEKIPEVCKVCGSGYIKSIGIGIERLERIVKRIFPDLDVRRLEDVCPKTAIILSTSKIISACYNLKFNIETCFVLDIDNMLSQIDYETTFNSFIYLRKVLHLVDKNLYIFTHNPHHYLWEGIIKEWNYFYDKELFLRKQLEYPPYGYIGKVTLRAKNKNRLIKKAQDLYNKLRDQNLEVFYPLEEVPFKLRGKYRYTVIIKSKSRFNILKKLDMVIADYRKSSSYKVAVVIR